MSTFHCISKLSSQGRTLGRGWMCLYFHFTLVWQNQRVKAIFWILMGLALQENLSSHLGWFKKVNKWQLLSCRTHDHGFPWILSMKALFILVVTHGKVSKGAWELWGSHRDKIKRVWDVESLIPVSPYKQCNSPCTSISRNFPGVIDATAVLHGEQTGLVSYSGYGQITNEENYEGKEVALSHLLYLVLPDLALDADSSNSEKLPSIAGPKTFTKHLNNWYNLWFYWWKPLNPLLPNSIREEAWQHAVKNGAAI